MRHSWEAKLRRPSGKPKGLRACRRCGLQLLELVQPPPRYALMPLRGAPYEADKVPPCPGGGCPLCGQVESHSHQYERTIGGGARIDGRDVDEATWGKALAHLAAKLAL